jgi:acyl-coenzyme A synthetase/AMP-(fatty) acid ligase
MDAALASETVAGFLAHADRSPDAPALVWHGATTSYAELAELAAKARARIDRLDLAAGEPVGVVAAKSPETIALTLAGLGAGRAVLLPATTLAPPALAAVLDQAGCRSLLSPGDGVPSGGSQAPRPRAAGVADGTAFVLATSGSTGTPKVVPLSHGAVDRFTRWAADRFGIGPATAVLNYAPLNFDLCLLDIWTTLRFGGTVVLVDPDRGTDGAHLWGLIDDHRVAVVQSVPMFYRLLLDASAGAGTSTTSGLASVEHVIVTGDALPARTLAELPRLFPAAHIHNVYGCTETNDSFVHDVSAADIARAEPLPLGEPIDGVDALLVGPDGVVVTGPGRGELYIATPFQTDGYLDPQLNAAKFVAHPRATGGRRYFRSGDLVRRTPDGRIVLEGRDDFQVKVRGVAVNTADVERVLLDHPQVAEAAVVAVADPVAGRRLHAAVRRAGTERLNSLALRQHLAGQLVTAAIPSTFRIADEPLPKTSTGKVDRRTVAHALAGANQQGE